MVFGRKQEASDEDTATTEASKPATARRRRPLPPGHRRGLGQGRQHLHQRRLHQFARRQGRQGRQLAEVLGRRGKEPGQFNTPHSIATDANGNVYVADRGNRRIQVFDGDGKFLRQFTIDVPVPPDAKPAIGKIPDEAMMAGGTFTPGSPWSICITPPPNQVLYTPTPGPAGSTSSASTARCWACSASPASS